MKIFNNLTHTKFGKSILILIGFLIIEILFRRWGIDFFVDLFNVNLRTRDSMMMMDNIYCIPNVVYYILWVYLLVKCCLYYKTTKEKIYFSQMLGIVIFLLFVIYAMDSMIYSWQLYGRGIIVFTFLISEVIINLLGLFLFRICLFIPKWIQHVPEPTNPWQGFCTGLKNSLRMKVNPNASRMEYWSFTVINGLFVVATIVAINLIVGWIGQGLYIHRSLSFIILPAGYILFSVYAQLRLMLRRLHDVGISGWLVVTEFVSSVLAGFCLGYTMTRGIRTSFVILGYIAYSVAGLVNLAIFILCLMPSAQRGDAVSPIVKKKTSNIEQLEKLAKLKDMGALTQQEFETKKKILLGVDK